jgi:hypothetical protein
MGKVKHGMTKLRPYKIWKDMLRRCYNENNQRFKSYGGRGIKVCSKWHNFAGFWDDMQKGYSDNLTIDRIDNNGNYEPSNCKWSTQKEQANNRNTNAIFEIEGETKTLMQWCIAYNQKYTTIRYRMEKGKTLLEALTTKKESPNLSIVIFEGKERKLIELCKEYNIKYNAVYARISRGMDVETALTLPIIKNKV